MATMLPAIIADRNETKAVATSSGISKPLHGEQRNHGTRSSERIARGSSETYASKALLLICIDLDPDATTRR
jgi:hypothetical protein